MSSLHEKSYTERLTLLSSPSLQYRWWRGDLIFFNKIVNNYFNTDFTASVFKLFKEHSKLCRSNYFINRITNDWKSLPNYVVNSSSINTCKSLLDSYLLDLRFCIRWHWSGIQAVLLHIFNKNNHHHNHNHPCIAIQTCGYIWHNM